MTAPTVRQISVPTTIAGGEFSANAGVTNTATKESAIEAARTFLADEGGDRPDVHATLDEMRAAYATFYEEAEAIASSSALAARREAHTDASAGRRPTGGAELIHHGLRALVPAPARRGIRRALGRER